MKSGKENRSRKDSDVSTQGDSCDEEKSTKSIMKDSTGHSYRKAGNYE